MEEVMNENVRGFFFEKFVTGFYFTDSLIGDFTDTEKVYYILSDIFLIPRNEAEEMFPKVFQPALASVRDEKSCDRLSRTIEYSGIVGYDLCMDDDDKMLVSCKKEAIAEKKALMKNESGLTPENVRSVLSNAALGGNIRAISSLAFFEYYGVFVCRNRTTAVKRLKLSAGWNDLFSCLMLLACDRENSGKYLGIISAVFANTPYSGAVGYVTARLSEKRTAESVLPSATARLLAKAFRTGILNPEVFDRKAFDLLSSSVIPLGEKERIIQCGYEKVIAEISALPINLADKKLEFASSDGYIHGGELDALVRNLGFVYMCDRDVYKPLWIKAKDPGTRFLCERTVIAGFGEENVVTVDLGTVSRDDILPTKNHFAVKALAKTGNLGTVIIIRADSPVINECTSEIRKLATASGRKNFSLSYPEVTLDLSHILPVFISQYDVPGELSEICESVNMKSVSEEDRDRMVSGIFSSVEKEFSVSALLEDDAKKYLAVLSPKVIYDLIGKVFRRAITERRSDDMIDSNPEKIRVDVNALRIADGDCVRKSGFGFVS